MSLLTVVLLLVAFLIAAALIATADKFIGPKLGYPRYIVHICYGLLVLVVILYLCRAFGVWELLSSVRV